MTDFLLELRCEEIPARMQARAKEDLARLFEEALAKVGLTTETVETFATPRRLALIARGLPLETESVREETKGPKVGAPPQAMEGFLRKTGLTQDQLEDRGGTWFATVEKPGRFTSQVLAEAIPALIRAFPWPKSMRWGSASARTESLRWVRPLHGIVAILGEELVPCAINGIESGFTTLGHRFHHPGAITIGGAHDYVEKLRACHVIVHFSERCAIIREGAARAAAEAELTLVEDEGLVAENAGLTEWPVPLLGRFDPAFLDVPEEVIQLTARVNQKYFVCQDAGGKLANAFVLTANIDASDGGAAIVAGNEKVLAARLSDARFFWEQDLKVPLEQQAAKLSQIVFHEKLGTVADKADRVTKLTRWLCEEGIVSGKLADAAERAARLAKADLVTGMVGEFPELQGVMGGHLARAQGEDAAIADAIRDHYKPVGQGDDVPTAPVTVAVSLADKLDSLICFFAIGAKPTGSKDPFALRRAGLGIISLIVGDGLRAGVGRLASGWSALFDPDGNGPAGLHDDLAEFFADRLKIQQRERGVRHDLIDAVFALGNEDDLVRLLSRVEALQAFMATEDGANLLAAYKRAANILKAEEQTQSARVERSRDIGVSTSLEANGEVPPTLDAGTPAPLAAATEQQIPQTGEEDPFVEVDHGMRRAIAVNAGRTEGTIPEGAEAADIALLGALDISENSARAAIAEERWGDAMKALALLRAPIDRFFDEVMVNDEDAAKRAFRLGLLARFRNTVHAIADFSKIEG